MKKILIGAMSLWGALALAQEMEVMRTNYTLVAQDNGGYYFAPTTSLPNVIGWNSSGALTNIPPDLTNAVQVSAGYQGYVALRDDGTVEQWGYQTEPVPSDLIGTNAVQVLAGYYYNVALMSDGSIVVWGSLSGSIVEATNLSQQVVQIARAGTNSFTVLFGDKSIVLVSNMMEFPQGVSGFVAISSEAPNNNQIKYEGIETSGTVYNWGFGNATNDPTWASNDVDIAVSVSKAAAIDSSGNLATWNVSGTPQLAITNGVALQLSSYGANLGWLNTNGNVISISGVPSEPPYSGPLSSFSVGQLSVIGIKQ